MASKQLLLKTIAKNRVQLVGRQLYAIAMILDFSWKDFLRG